MLYTERAELILQQLQLQAVVKITDLTELLRSQWILCAGI